MDVIHDWIVLTLPEIDAFPDEIFQFIDILIGRVEFFTHSLILDRLCKRTNSAFNTGARRVHVSTFQNRFDRRDPGGAQAIARMVLQVTLDPGKLFGQASDQGTIRAGVDFAMPRFDARMDRGRFVLSH